MPEEKVMFLKPIPEYPILNLDLHLLPSLMDSFLSICYAQGHRQGQGYSQSSALRKLMGGCEPHGEEFGGGVDSQITPLKSFQSSALGSGKTPNHPD